MPKAVTRREFLVRPFAALVSKLTAPAEGEAVPGRIPLSSLREFPEAILMDMAPVLRQGWSARISQTDVAYTGDAGQEGIVELGPEGAAAVALFDGTRTLSQVSSELAARSAMEPDRSWGIVREAFLTLAQREVYHPKDPPPPAPPPDGGRRA